MFSVVVGQMVFGQRRVREIYQSVVPTVSKLSRVGRTLGLGKWGENASALKWALVIFATMRISLSLIAVLALYQFPLYPVPVGYYHGVPPVPSGIANYLLGVWQRGDTLWYSTIAMNGYSPGDGSTVFFPLYPLLMRLLGRYLLSGNYLLAGIFVSNTAYLFALVYLYKLTELEFAPEVALRAIIYLSAFPTAFFFLQSRPFIMPGEESG
jgi:Gpi18-like mannosyltransferase